MSGGARSRPFPVQTGLLFRRIDAGFFHTCGVTTGDRAYCWGYNINGQLGDGTSGSPRATPAPVAGELRFNSVSAAVFHTCGVTLAGRGFCWGENGQGQLGDGTTTTRLSPTALGGDLSLVQLSAGDSFGCAVAGAGRAYCWGDNYAGQIGDGSQTRRLLPVPVAGP
jgi:alpha-tubulin suppressor-like RCC1 family protein